MPGNSVPRRAVLAGGAALLARPASAAVVNLVVVGKDGWLFPVWDEVRHSEPALIRRITGTLNEAIGLLQAAKIDTAISLTPAKSRVFRDMLPDDVQWSADADRRYRLALAELRRPGTLVPDQAALFAGLQAGHGAGSLFFKADTHWTALGAGQAALAMAEQIKLARRLPPSSTPGPRLGPPQMVTQERNDLAALLPVAEQARYAFEAYPVRKPAAGDTLLDEEAADVVVLGNSYVQPAYGFTDMLAEQLGRPTALFWRVHQMSPYWDMLTYLKGDGFKRQRPRLIVWNLAESDMEAPSNNPGIWGNTAMPAANFLSEMRQALTA